MRDDMRERILDNVRRARNEIIMKELILGEEYDKHVVMNNYKNFMHGLSVGLGYSVSVTENLFDKSMLGSHDLKLMLNFNSQEEIYEIMKSEQKGWEN